MSPEWAAAWAAIATILGSIALFMGGGGWWLRSQFAANREHTSKVMEAHETIDRERHEQNITKFNRQDDDANKRHLENIAKFNKIDVRLARMGNGRLRAQPDDNGD